MTEATEHCCYCGQPIGEDHSRRAFKVERYEEWDGSALLVRQRPVSAGRVHAGSCATFWTRIHPRTVSEGYRHGATVPPSAMSPTRS